MGHATSAGFELNETVNNEQTAQTTSSAIRNRRLLSKISPGAALCIRRYREPLFSDIHFKMQILTEIMTLFLLITRCVTGIPWQILCNN